MLYLIDMDDVLFDFIGAAKHHYNETFDTPENFNSRDHSAMYSSFTFWADMPLLPWAKDLVNWTKGNYIIVSHAQPQYECRRGKLEALRMKLGVLPDRVIFTPFKYLLANDNHLLIDDNERNCDAFVEHGGRAYLWPAWSNWKCEHEDPWERFLQYHDKDYEHG